LKKAGGYTLDETRLKNKDEHERSASTQLQKAAIKEEGGAAGAKGEPIASGAMRKTLEEERAPHERVCGTLRRGDLRKRGGKGAQVRQLGLRV